MDKIKNFMRFLRKQHFWLIVPVLLVLMLVAWFSAASTAISTFETGAANVKKQFADMSQVSGLTWHPNEKFDEEMTNLIQQRAQDVAEAWEIQYAKQVDTMQWSPTMAEEAPDFVEAVNDLRPIEEVPKDKVLPPWMLAAYRDFIVKEELKRLAGIIGSKWVVAEGDLMGSMGGGYGGYGSSDGYGGYGPSSSSSDEAITGGGYGGYGGGYGGYGGDGGYSSYGGDWDDGDGTVVRWNAQNQQQIQATSFGWSLRGSGQPTVIEMLYSQEDVWVLDSLMQVIKNTNGNAKHRSQAVIKEIQAIEIGKIVGGPRGKVSDVQAASSAGEEEDAFGMTGGMGGGMSDDAYGSGGYGGYASGDVPGGGAYSDGYGNADGTGMGSAPQIDPADRRYVDADYQPISSEVLNAKAESALLSDVQVAKRMPVRMRVKMDSRRIADLLAACANAPLTFEVHQLRLNPQATAPDAFGGAGGYGGYGTSGYGSASDESSSGYGGSSPDGGGGYDAAPGYGGYGGYGGATSSDGYGGYGQSGGYAGFGEDGRNPAEETVDEIVELFGIIYIYNPVDRVKLGLEQADTAVATDAIDQ